MQHAPNSAAYAWDDTTMSALGQYMTQQLAKCIQEQLACKRSGRLLDVGCGTGKYMRLAEQFQWRTVGLEYDATPLRIFRNRCNGANLVQGDAQALPFADGSFDVVLAAEVQDYFPNRPAFHREVHRVLADDGVFLLTMSNRRSIKGLMTIVRNGLFGKKTTARFYETNFDACMEELYVSNFHPVSFHGYQWNCLPRQCNNLMLVNAFALLERLLKLYNCPRYSPLIFITCKKSDLH